jgi:hypothetical protein
VVGTATTTTTTITTKEDNKDASSSSSSYLQAFTPRALLAVVENENKSGETESSAENNATIDIDIEIDIDIDTERLRKPSGLSRAKCNCVLAIARCFEAGTLSEAFLIRHDDNDIKIEHDIKIDNTEEVRSRLLSIKGLGPWSVDMFMMFRCHRSNVLPIGDLAVRNGTAALWKIHGNGNGNTLCAKKDAAAITELHAPFEPYRSVSSYYMYKVADAMKKKKKPKKQKKPTAKKTRKKGWGVALVDK